MKMEIEDSRFIAGIYSTAKDKEETTLKKAFSLFLTIAIVFSLAACNQNEDKGKSASPPPESIAADSAPVEPSGETQPEIEQETQSQAPSEATTGSNILTAYFSWADNAVLTEDVDAVSSPSVIPPGNVQQLAGWVQEETGGDLFSIRVTEPYPSDWDACLERTNEERGSGARPELQENVSNLEQYDTVFLGYPNWWYGAPMALLSFLEQNDLSGKDVYLFCSHGTGGLAGSVEQIVEAAPDAVISDNIFDCYEEEAASSENAIREWVNSLGFSSQTETGSEANSESTSAQQRQISVEFEDGTAVYALNDGSAADALYEMLPLTIEVEDYSTNEKIFYPEEELDTSDSPLAQDGAGTLAYYEPWGDVVFFYGDYKENPGLFELGHVVSGGELISGMSGTITIEAVKE